MSNDAEMKRTSLLEEAHCLLGRGSSNEAFKIFKQLSEDGLAEASISLGWMYKNGIGTARSFELAKSSYELAVLAGQEWAHYYLGRLLLEFGDDDGAFESFHEGAQRGNLAAIYWLGSMYDEGRGTPLNHSHAHHYLKVAAARGHIFAKRDLAKSLITGRYGNRSRLLGIIQWINAVVSGSVLAIRNSNSERLM